MPGKSALVLGRTPQSPTRESPFRVLLGERLRLYQIGVNDPYTNQVTPRELTRARKELDLSPFEMARAMGVPYDTYKSWQSGRRAMPAVAVRCVELLLLYPKTAQ